MVYAYQNVLPLPSDKIFCLFRTLRIKKKQMSNNMKQIETDVHQVAIKYPWKIQENGSSCTKRSSRNPGVFKHMES